MQWYDSIISQSPTDTIRDRHWLMGNIENEFHEKGIQRIEQDLTIGEKEFSEIQKDLITVYPNPTAGEVFVEYHSRLKEKGYISVYSEIGDEVYKEKVHAVEGSNVYILDLGHVSSGIYHVRLTMDSVSYSSIVVR